MAPVTILPDCYAILGISQSADSSTVKSTYKKLALVKHPDRRRGEPHATAEFQLVSMIASFNFLFDISTDAVTISSTKHTSSFIMSISTENTTEYISQQSYPRR